MAISKPTIKTIAKPAVRIGAAFFGIISASALSIVLLYQVFSPQSPEPRGFAGMVGLILAIYAASTIIYVWHITYKRFYQLSQAMDDLNQARAEAEAANKAKTRFLAKMSHEIRTPMNGVLGMNSLLLETPLNDEQKSYANAVDASARALLSVIDEILDTTKIESDSLTLNPKPFNLTELIEQVVELLAPRAHAKGIEIASIIDPEIPELVTCDPVRLRQVLLNLAGNSIKFTSRGGVTVKVTVDHDVKPAENMIALQFVVSDTGIGISKQDQEKIFALYAQTSEGAHKKYGGTGLGLPISRQIIQKMGGDITVTSQQNHGSQFRFDLTLPGEFVRQPPEQDLAGKIVAVAMADGPTRDSVTYYLERFGAKIVDVPNQGDELDLSKLPLDISHMIIEQADEGISRRWIEQVSAGFPLVQSWLIMQPEHRRWLAKVLADSDAGFLVKPVRRKTLHQQLVQVGKNTLEKSVEVLRAKVSQSRNEKNRPLSILLAEDNPINALLAKAMLKKAGHRIVHVEDGKKVIEHMQACMSGVDKSTKPDLILMDVFMPQMNGIDATIRLRKLEQENKWQKTPVLALTANARKEDESICQLAGMDGYLSKPFDQQDLCDAIESLFLPKSGQLAAKGSADLHKNQKTGH